MAKKKVTRRRVYVPFLRDSTVAVHPSNCTGDRYRVRAKGSIHLSKNVSAANLGEAILAMCKNCRVK